MKQAISRAAHGTSQYMMVHQQLHSVYEKWLDIFPKSPKHGFFDCRQPDTHMVLFQIASLKAWRLEMWSNPWQILFLNAKAAEFVNVGV